LKIVKGRIKNWTSNPPSPRLRRAGNRTNLRWSYGEQGVQLRTSKDKNWTSLR